MDEAEVEYRLGIERYYSEDDLEEEQRWNEVFDFYQTGTSFIDNHQEPDLPMVSFNMESNDEEVWSMSDNEYENQEDSPSYENLKKENVEMSEEAKGMVDNKLSGSVFPLNQKDSKAFPGITTHSDNDDKGSERGDEFRLKILEARFCHLGNPNQDQQLIKSLIAF